jgi:hypothetical protein
LHGEAAAEVDARTVPLAEVEQAWTAHATTGRISSSPPGDRNLLDNGSCGAPQTALAPDRPVA